MSETHHDVVGIGNAIVDVISRAKDEFLERHGLVKGSMALIDAEEAEALYADMGPGVEISGGSAANTVAGLSSLGGRGAYIGKVADDQLGKVFAHDIRATGVHYATEPSASDPPTARCLVLVTEDGQRTMNTFLGASAGLSPADIDDEIIAASKVSYLEGYLWDPPAAKEAFRKAAEVAHAASRKVALSLSDPFCVDRHRQSFLELVEGHVDILFANEAEICSLFEVDDFGEAVAAIRGRCEVAALTRSEKGALILTSDGATEIAAQPVKAVVDTTGAGDLFAAGFLYGYTQGKSAASCARYGAIAAAEVISHVGARPEADLAELIRRSGA